MEECYFLRSDFLSENYKDNVVKRKTEKLETEHKEEEKSSEKVNEIRSYESECENGVPSEQLSTHTEPVCKFEW